MSTRVVTTAPALLAIAIATVVAIAGCTPTDPATPSASPSDSGTTVESPGPSPTPEVSESPAGLSDADYENIAASISSGNTAALEGYLSEPVNFIIAASECCGPVTRVEAINGLDYVSGATGPWTYPIGEPTLASYRAGFYVDYFPAGVFVMQSADADPYVVAFAIDGSTVTGVFVAGGATLLAP
jgi:hypothetical protein